MELYMVTYLYKETEGPTRHPRRCTPRQRTWPTRRTRRRTPRQWQTLTNKDYLNKQTGRNHLDEDNHSSQARDCHSYKEKYQYKFQDKVDPGPLPQDLLPRPLLLPLRRHRCGRARGGGRTAW